MSEPPWTPGLAFILDAEGKAAIASSLPSELAHFLVERVNAGEYRLEARGTWNVR
ncbi:MAG TPA: hypothetical protein VLK35_06290 [Methylomirabilota bacterium]|nr:hypothetical protein [Methylomirabilota bacterium]